MFLCLRDPQGEIYSKYEYSYKFNIIVVIKLNKFGAEYDHEYEQLITYACPNR